MHTATVIEDTVLYRYEMCNNLSSEAATANIPLCVNSTEFLDYNNTDDEILQVPIYTYGIPWAAGTYLGGGRSMGFGPPIQVFF